MIFRNVLSLYRCSNYSSYLNLEKWFRIILSYSKSILSTKQVNCKVIVSSGLLYNVVYRVHSSALILVFCLSPLQDSHYNFYCSFDNQIMLIFVFSLTPVLFFFTGSYTTTTSREWAKYTFICPQINRTLFFSSSSDTRFILLNILEKK